MSKTRYLAGLCLAGGLALSPAGRADLYSAQQAYNKQDYVQAFAQYRELAEMGQPLAQENLAVMYVSGEGVKRDNVLGYAWALIARENGGSDAMQNIISQLEPHLVESMLQRVAAVQAQFGKAALQQRLYPEILEPGQAPTTPPDPNGCTFLKPANPDDYYPRAAIQQGLSGNVEVQYTVMPDGRARNPRVTFAMPLLAFDAPAANVILKSTFKPRTQNGVAVPCSMVVRVKFVSRAGIANENSPDLKKLADNARPKAVAGDPSSQLAYGMMLEAMASTDPAAERPATWYLKAAQAGIPSAQYLIGSPMLRATGPNSADKVKKGLFWITKAADAGQADAQVDLANYLLSQPGDPANRARAYDLLEKAAKSESREGKYRLAALLASDADETRRDPKRALGLLEQVMIDKELDPTAFEIRAAANATSGDFDAARNDQGRAIRMAAKLGWDLAPQKARLAKYESSAAWTGDLLAL